MAAGNCLNAFQLSVRQLLLPGRTRKAYHDVVSASRPDRARLVVSTRILPGD